jgi:hypothetical protein
MNRRLLLRTLGPPALAGLTALSGCTSPGATTDSPNATATDTPRYGTSTPETGVSAGTPSPGLQSAIDPHESAQTRLTEAFDRA